MLWLTALDAQFFEVGEFGDICSDTSLFTEPSDATILIAFTDLFAEVTTILQKVNNLWQFRDICESISFFSKKLNPEDTENSYYVCPCLCAV